ncbi:transcription initiation protein [Paenarthrobacter sp. S56]|uniref:YciI family protein n=1 Tax=Paenarthrobacter sp. S56 TaxID=3138179 RepID=UPI00321AC074
MTKYLISFPGEAMVIPEGQFQAVADDAHAVIEEAKQAGVYVFGGGINEDVAPVRVSGDGSVQPGMYPGHTVPNGGYTVLELPSREAAIEWAAKIAVACRCPQELREFQHDPAS